MSSAWRQEAESQFGATIVSAHRVSGGDFAEAFEVTLDNSGEASLGDNLRVFIKTHRQPPPLFFSTEATGLRWLHETQTVSIPRVLAVCDDPPLLALEWIDQSSRQHQSNDESLGRALAMMHRTAWPHFGRPDHCTTGSLALPNDRVDTWPEFYSSQRLLPLAKLAQDRGALATSTIAQLESVANRLSELCVPDEPPSLLHGDLWAGNRIVDSAGASWLIDPAVHGGHREFDVAMMHLFGGFNESCFAAYNEVYPLAPGWSERIALHQLAPLTVHAIKFAGPYPNAVEQALSRFA